jgi:hypothetical protein
MWLWSGTTCSCNTTAVTLRSELGVSSARGP